MTVTEQVSNPSKAEVLAKKIVQLRLVVARHGEMDRSKWWNTKGLLSNIGELALSRGFPKSHVFACARAVFAVASARSEEVFDPPDSFTLWHLPADIEDLVEDAWSRWLEHPDEWKDTLAQINAVGAGDLVEILVVLKLVSEVSVGRAKGLRRADDRRSVPIKTETASAIDAIELLALAHSSSETAKLAVPFIREEDFPK